MANLLVTSEGDIIDNDNSNHHPKTSVKSILTDLVGKPLDDEIKTKAESLYQQAGAPTRKNHKRDEMIFTFVHFAHAELNRIHSVKKLAKMFEVDSNKISKIVSCFTLSKIGYHFPQRFYSISDYCKFLAQEISLGNDLYPFVMETADNILNKDPTLEICQPDLVAGSIILYTIELFYSKSASKELNELHELIIGNMENLTKMKERIKSIDT